MQTQFQQHIDILKNSVEKLALKRAPENSLFTLKSGKQSKYYLDCRKVTLSPVSNYACVRAIVDTIALNDIEFDAIGGPALGAIPIVGGLANFYGHAFATGESFEVPSFFFVRKQEKGHGLNNLIEGPVKPGQKAVIVEDVTTSGDSAAKAVLAARQYGLFVDHVVCIVDREEGGVKTLNELKVQLHPLLRKSDFGL